MGLSCTYTGGRSPQRMREHVVQVRVSELELARLDPLSSERCSTRSGVLRGALDPAPAGEGGRDRPATRNEALMLLAVAPVTARWWRRRRRRANCASAARRARLPPRMA